MEPTLEPRTEPMTNLYAATWEYLSVLPAVQAWPDLHQFLARVIRNKPPHWRMAARACLATGGTLAQAIPAVAALATNFLAIVLIDDLLDDDPKGQHLTLGIGNTANMASALQAIGLEAIMRCDLPPTTQATILRLLNSMMLQTSVGQYLDTQNPRDEESYWRVTRTKSSPYFVASLHVGALMSGAEEAIATQLGEMGAIYGEMIQINDDLNDALAVPADPDWLQGRYPLPILFASLVPHPEREHFIALRAHVSEESALAEAQEILIRCGAVSYCIDQLLQREQKLSDLLHHTPLAQPALLQEMMDSVIKPVQTLLAQMEAQMEAQSGNRVRATPNIVT